MSVKAVDDLHCREPACAATERALFLSYCNEVPLKAQMRKGNFKITDQKSIKMFREKT